MQEENGRNRNQLKTGTAGGGKHSMNILYWFLMNWDSVLLVLAVTIVFIVLYVRGNKKLLNKFLFTAVTEAERQYKSGTGLLKKASVIAMNSSP